jgi:hypothetical protein
MVAQEKKSEKFGIFVVSGDDARPVAESLIQKLRDSKPFEPVSKEDVSKAIVLIDCLHRDKSSPPLACMYVLHYNGATFQTFLGGGLYVSMTADDMANNFLAALAADIVERYDDTAKKNLRASLQTCLFLTESKCNVPDSLQHEIGEKQISLSQYLLKGSP